jgi:DNA (cytosine-5)-methyltransferase 1
MTAYYNEIDPYAAQWLRNLIATGHIAPGIVDERSIEDVKLYELTKYTQCHFFAGIGVWSYALRQAGWPDDKPVWTGSCPCQPFSAAGKGAGFDDERHLWPAWQWLIQQCQPAAIFGEQVASKATESWVDLVQTDLEAMGYAFGCVPFPSAGVGAPHLRDRNFWVANSQANGFEWPRKFSESSGWDGSSHMCSVGDMADSNGLRQPGERRNRQGGVAEHIEAGGMGHTNSKPAGRNTRGAHRSQTENGPSSCNDNGSGDASDRSSLLGDTQGERCGEEGQSSAGYSQRPTNASPTNPIAESNATNGFWGAADWLFCRDGKWRPVEPGTFPLADGLTNRVGRLRAYGNAINAEAAKEFIKCVMNF